MVIVFLRREKYLKLISLGIRHKKIYKWMIKLIDQKFKMKDNKYVDKIKK